MAITTSLHESFDLTLWNFDTWMFIYEALLVRRETRAYFKETQNE